MKSVIAMEGPDDYGLPWQLHTYEKIELSYSNTALDFGRGFYVTSLFDQAKIWAERIGRNSGVSQPEL